MADALHVALGLLALQAGGYAVAVTAAHYSLKLLLWAAGEQQP